MKYIPDPVMDEIATAVSSAIRNGVSAEDFRKWVAYLWQEELQEKVRRDLKTLTTV